MARRVSHKEFIARLSGAQKEVREATYCDELALHVETRAALARICDELSELVGKEKGMASLARKMMAEHAKEHTP